MSVPWLIAGLGNAGRGFRENRHNAGFMVLDRAAKSWGTDFSKTQNQALIAESRRDGDKLLLAKPQTMMNLSGRAVAPLARYYRIPLEQIIVVYDDLDLPLGSLRLRPFGGTGGHRGMESIVHELGSDNFARLRIGIGRPPGRMDAADYVLQDFSSGEAALFSDTADTAVDCLSVFLTDGIETAMTRFNGGPEEAA
ncbi:MAG: aminoacyl-tRNA hydrolase [Anaerolineales bacterium]|jgi:PTH1 family peptidyl-tRNA hydrolase